MYQQLRKLLKKSKLVRYIYYTHMRHVLDAEELSGMSTKDIFSSYFKHNTWAGRKSVSGRGSDPDQVKKVIEIVQQVVREYDIKRMLDIPCGDFAWMKKACPEDTAYTGGDIVAEMIAQNNERYANEKRQFIDIDLITSPLPDADLLICRDALVHFSDADVLRTLNNIAESNIRYFLTTSFHERDNSIDIVTGQWRALNLEVAPFNLPEPLARFNEECPESSAKDKSLLLWEVQAIREAL